MSVAERRVLAREATISALVAAAIASLLAWLGPPGVDLAAHAYQRAFLLQHGFSVWNNFWYAGRYSFVTYSVVYYPLAAYLGIKVLAVATVSAAALAFTLVVGREWGPPARFSSRTFAVLWGGVVLSAAFPFALGAAFALLALSALQQQRRRLFALLVLLTLLASPLAFLLLALILAGSALEGRPRRATVAVVVGAGALELVVRRLFPDTGQYPFAVADLLPGLAFGLLGMAATARVEGAKRLFGLFAFFFAAIVIAFVLPSDLGSNVERLKFAAIPLAVLAVALAPRRIIVAIALVTVAGWWNISALAHTAQRASGDPTHTAAYWQPSIRYLRSHLSPSFRVEAVDTADHWAAAYLPDAGIPIVRGWYRQNDFPQNGVLYQPKLAALTYGTWLRHLGVRYVVLPDATPDYSARVEADLVRSGKTNLMPVFRDAHVTIYELPHATPIVSGPGTASVPWMWPSRLVLQVDKPGTYRVALRWSPYWHSHQGCVSRGKDGMVRVAVPRAGLVDLNFKLGVGRGLEALAGIAGRTCPAATIAP